jgi:predicted glycogen debranching enzyme
VRFEKENKDIFISGNGFNFEYGAAWYDNFTFPRERERGFDDSEDLYMPGIISVQLMKGNKFGLVLSTDPEEIQNPFLLLEEEKNRREKLVKGVKNETIKKLSLAADQFIVRRGEDKKTIIAGYPWFGDWGRDTMIALMGLCHATGRMSDSEKILSEFSEYVSEGMLPNLFPDGQNHPEYNTIDGTLWYFVAIYDYLQSGGNLNKITREFLPVLGEIIDWHLRGTRYGIKADEDGLLKGGDQSIQLTWMDARVGERVITPRSGKAVEINALWYNAIRIYAHLLQISGDDKKAAAFEKRAGKIRKSFLEMFWNEKENCLFDVIDNERKDQSIRPNQLFAVSLPFPLLKGAKARGVLEVVTKTLLTPAGIRSLAPASAGYLPYYDGNNEARDEAYHQGTVWSWLLGPYIDALVSVEGGSGKAKAEEILNAFMPHLDEACVGSISEIFDAAPPHNPKGAVAQAWSVGEILRVIKRHGLSVSGSKINSSKKNVQVG